MWGKQHPTLAVELPAAAWLVVLAGRVDAFDIVAAWVAVRIAATGVALFAGELVEFVEVQRLHAAAVVGVAAFELQLRLVASLQVAEQLGDASDVEFVDQV